MNLTIFYIPKHTKKKLNNKYDSALLIEWDALREILWKENCVVSPFKFVKVVQKIANIKGYEMFTGFDQNDLPEFLMFIIDCFHNSLAREVIMSIEGEIKDEKDKIAIKCFERIKQMYEKDYSEVLALFYGIQVSILENAETGEKINMIPESYFIINLPIPENNKLPSLIDCFDLYVENEVLDGDNKLTNENTGEKFVAKKKIMFWNFPNILVIDIKRFNSMNRKNQILVNFPLENLDLSKYVIGYNKDSYIYDLYGVCNHSGSVLGGHYTSFVKNANDKWYHFNDTNVSEVGLAQQIITPKAYCFFYRKREMKQNK
uniref:USP domain-containing protein n=1 Tax=viral metagenome TaxID=1070528 RepID=A0A6C0KSY5_9ZZZZ